MIRILFRLLVVTVIVIAALLAYALLLPAGPLQEQRVQLKPGSSARRIAADLEKAGAVKQDLTVCEADQ